ncbi:MAG: DMT family transporter [candidate division NC10 bacterium]|nr:DMT family transporter [candidate division NC10 bacterium]
MLRGEELKGAGLAVAATACFSAGAVLVRFAQALSPFEVTAYRLLLGAALVGAAARIRGLPLALEGRLRLQVLGVGLVAALHFLTFISSIYYTTIAHALTLTYTAPAMVAVASGLLFRERLRARQALGIGLAVVGIAILAGFEPTLTARMLTGDLLALGAAASFAAYSLLGRQLRAALPLLRYVFWLYLTAGLLTLPLAGATLTAPYASGPLLAVALQALLPLALGHTLYNAAVRHLSPTLVSLIASQEVTGGVLLGWVLLGEGVTPTTFAGMAVTLAGILLVLR